MRRAASGLLVTDPPDPGGTPPPYAVALVVNDPNHNSTTNVKADLETLGHTVTVVEDGNISTTNFSSYDLIVAVRSLATQALADDLYAVWDSGIPVMLPGLANGTAGGSGRSTSPTFLDLTQTWQVISSSSGNDANDITDASHPITSEQGLGTVTIYSGGNWMSALDTGAAFVGDTLADGDPTTDLANQDTLIAVEEGTSRLGTSGATPARAVVWGDMYAGQSGYTADGRALIQRMLRWMMKDL